MAQLHICSGVAVVKNYLEGFFGPVERNTQYEFEETIHQDINFRIDNTEKEEYLEIKCELISLMYNARHNILNMNDDPNALKCIKNVKSNWNGIQKMVGEVENYHNKRTIQATIHSGHKL